jgi:hypothetical protein
MTYGQYPYLEVCNAFYNQPGWYGLFQPDQLGHLTKGYIQFDDADPPNDAAAKRYVACHELGHSVGLAHRASGTSCMNTVSPGYQSPDSHDIEMLDRNIYQYSDGDYRHDDCYNAAPSPGHPRPDAIALLGPLATDLDLVAAAMDSARTMIVFPDGTASPLDSELMPPPNCF